MPPVIAVTLGLMGVAALARWCVKEMQRVNAELDGIRATSRVEPIDRNGLPTLRPRSPNRRIPAGVAVIPDRHAAANPKSIFADLWLWIPGSRLSAAPRNDEIIPS